MDLHSKTALAQPYNRVVAALAPRVYACPTLVQHARTHRPAPVACAALQSPLLRSSGLCRAPVACAMTHSLVLRSSRLRHTRPVGNRGGSIV
ncbi:hypothetical protein U1Q18_038062 [Sarracenia purpurea var. burkii]